MPVLAFDLGTTQWKAGMYDEVGRELAVSRMPTPTLADGQGHAFYDPLALPGALAGLCAQLPHAARRSVQAVALAGMAEAGLWVSRVDGQPQTDIVPWYDRRSVPVFERLRDDARVIGRERITGLPNSYKYGIYKLLALKEQVDAPFKTLLWLDLISYAAFSLCGSFAAEPTLAARSFCLDLQTRTWDEAFLSSLHLFKDIFAPLLPTGAAMGALGMQQAERFGVPSGIPICLCGHDHLCAAYGAHSLTPQSLFCSMGTAQVFLGVRDAQALTDADVGSGLSFGPLPAGEGVAVLGAIQSAGGSVAWLKDRLYAVGGYDAMQREALAAPCPTGIIYLPYLAGSGAPHANVHARGCFVGLTNDTTSGQMALAVYEGIAYESRFILEAANLLHATECVVCGGLTAHGGLMQVLADVLGLPVQTLDVAEATLLGAARLAYQGLGVSLPKPRPLTRYSPREAQCAVYGRLYQYSYLPLQATLLQHFTNQAQQE